jgi:hypothetical protein
VACSTSKLLKVSVKSKLRNTVKRWPGRRIESDGVVVEKGAVV